MEKLSFLNPVFKKGLNFTVRLGTKWVNKLSIGDFIEIAGWDGFGQIKKIYICRLAETPEEVLKNEHDMGCRTLDGLMSALKFVYSELSSLSDEEIENQVVTCIGFYLYKRY